MYIIHTYMYTKCVYIYIYILCVYIYTYIYIYTHTYTYIYVAQPEECTLSLRYVMSFYTGITILVHPHAYTATTTGERIMFTILLLLGGFMWTQAIRGNPSPILEPLTGLLLGNLSYHNMDIS